MPALTDTVALVTGASRGIGAAIASELAAAGAYVIVNYRSQHAAAARVVDEITQRGDRAEAIAFDVADAEAVDQAVRDATARLGKIDILVNNAGLSADAL